MGCVGVPIPIREVFALAPHTPNERVIAPPHPDAPMADHTAQAKRMLANHYWVVLFRPSDDRYWGARQGSTDHQIRGACIHADAVEALTDASRRNEVIKNTLRTHLKRGGYFLIGAFREVPSLGPGPPPASLWGPGEATRIEWREHSDWLY
jgi:hypothetical protein